MKLYPSVGGRGAGNVGYNFTASADRLPYSASWIGALRASDTTSDHKPILEMRCVDYGQPVVISSQWVVDSCSFGFSEYMEIELPENKEERVRYLNHPGQALYLEFMDGKTFLEMSSRSGVKHVTLPVMEVQLPSVQAACSFKLPQDMMAALLADTWSASFLKLYEARNAKDASAAKAKTSPLRLQLAVEAGDTLDAGCAFINQELLPRLPVSVRHIISVSIGSHWSSVNNTANPPALAITLPESGAWHMKGGYNLDTGDYEMAGPPLYLEFGKALLSRRHMEYEEPLNQDWVYTPVAANFLVVYYLFLLHKMLHTEPLDSKTLSDASQLFQALERVIRQYHENITDSQRRILLLPAERDWVRKRTSMHHEIVDDMKSYDLFVRKAFSIDSDLKAQQEESLLETLKNAYVDLLCVPETLSDCAVLPVSRIWTEPELSGECIKANPDLFVQCVQRTLALHADALFADKSSFDKLLSMYAAMEEPAFKQSLGQTLADAMTGMLKKAEWPPFLIRIRKLLEKQTDSAKQVNNDVLAYAEGLFADSFANRDVRRRFKDYGDNLDSAAQQLFFEDLSYRYCRYTTNDQARTGHFLDGFIDVCSDFDWLEWKPVQQTIYTALQYRGMSPAPRLSETEKETLLSFAKDASIQQAADIEKALTPIANHTTDPEVISFLSTLLPLIKTHPLTQPLTAGWETAFKLQIQQTLSAVFEEARQQLPILRSPQDAWKKHCRFSWLSLRFLDELTQWYAKADELQAFAKPLVMEILNGCSLADLLLVFNPPINDSDWFSKLLKNEAARRLASEKLADYAAECRSYTQIVGLQSLCDHYLASDDQKDIRTALGFAATRKSQDSLELIRTFGKLADRQTAGLLLRALLTSEDAGPWSIKRWDDLLVLSYLSNASEGKRGRQLILSVLMDTGIDFSLIDTLNPWDGGSGTKAFQTLLHVFDWLDQTHLETMENVLLQALQSAAIFTRAVHKGKNLKRIYASVLPLDQAQKSAAFSPALLAWLFPAQTGEPKITPDARKV